MDYSSISGGRSISPFITSNMNTYKIISIEQKTGVVEVAFAFDKYGSYQRRIGGVPLGTADELDDYMQDYMVAYIRGKEEEEVQHVAISDDVTALIGKKQAFSPRTDPEAEQQP